MAVEPAHPPHALPGWSWSWSWMNAAVRQGRLKSQFRNQGQGLALVTDEHDTIDGWVVIRTVAPLKRGETVDGALFIGYMRAPQTHDRRWPVTALRICQESTGTSFASPE